MILKVLIIILAIFIGIRTICYGIFEIKQNKNTPAGVSIIFISIFAVVFATIMILIR